MKKSILALILLSLITISSCTKEDISYIKDVSYINLDLGTFGEIYKLSKDELPENIRITPRETHIMHSLSQTEFQDIYNTLIKLKCRESTKNKTATTKNTYEYTVDFTIKEEKEIRNFNIVIGESYLLVSLIGDDDYIYKHEIYEDDYKNIIRMLDSIKQSLFESNISNDMDTQLDTSRDMVEKIKTIETLEHQYNNFFITYKEYNKGLEGIYMETDTEDNPHIRIYNAYLRIAGKDLIKEEIEEIRSKKEEIGDTHDIEVEISDVYTEEDRTRKYIYSKAKLVYKDYEFIEYFTNRYIFVKQDNEWVLIGADRGYYDSRNYDEETAKDRKPPYTQFNGEDVIYTEKFKPCE